MTHLLEKYKGPVKEFRFLLEAKKVVVKCECHDK